MGRTLAEPRVCHCGATFRPQMSDVKRGWGQSCSRKCALPRLKPSKLNLVGVSFGSLVVEMLLRGHIWRCRCACGGSVDARECTLLSGQRSTCGCRIKHRSKHGESTAVSGKASVEYHTWRSMIGRTRGGVSPAEYRDRGIGVCDRWAGKDGFQNFLSDMGRRPGPGYSLDRIDNDRGYSPDNCRWATWKQQGRNKRNNRLITAHGKTQTMSAWAEEMGLPDTTILSRLTRGWSEERAVSPRRTASGGA